MDKLVGEARSTVTLTPNAFKRDGYVFSGWNTDRDGGGTSYRDKDRVRLDGDMTLYAQWTKSGSKAGVPSTDAPERTSITHNN